MKTSTHADPLFVDTWGWLVLADRKESAHARADLERKRDAGSLVTSDFVLDETFTRLFQRTGFQAARDFSSAVLETAKLGQLRLERITPVRFEAAFAMRLRYRNKPGISFTDFTSFIVMQELGIRDVLTGDAHFTQVRLGFRKIPD